MDRPEVLTGRSRVGLIVLAAVLLALLAAARLIKPDPRHLGTHQRFGLPPCSVRVLFGVRCPTCGMTTAWAHLVRGQPVDAFRANVGGALLAVLAAVAVPWLTLSALSGTWRGWTPRSRGMALLASAIVLVTLVDWTLRLIAG